MQSTSMFKKTVVATLVAGLCAPQLGWSDPLDLSKLPPGMVSIPPTPDVVLSVDNSGSMSEAVGGGDPQSKMYRLKEALNAVFSDMILLPNDKIRLSWQSMWQNNGGPAGMSTLTPGAVNSMRSLDATHRANFFTFVNALAPSGNTPSHKMMMQTYNYMKTPQGINSPWASKPGVTEQPYLACRRAYHIFMTDGAWNGIYSAADYPGQADYANFTLPDGTLFDMASAQTKVYQGAQADVLADWGMRMWGEDLQPGIPNQVKPSTTDGVPTTETVGGVALQRYWNPRHDPATWQHLTQYTIGYGKDAYQWPAAPAWDLVNDDNYGGGYPNLVNGTNVWPAGLFNLNANNPSELWHVALTSRGKFYPTGPGRKHTLQDAFRRIIEDINLANTADVASMAASSTTNQRTSLDSYTAGYDPKKWSGLVKSNTIDTSGNVTTNSSWGMTGSTPNNTAMLLDSRTTPRVILTMNDLSLGGVSFEWETGVTKLSAAQKALLNLDGKGQQRVDYLRGDRSLEGGTVTLPFRVRDSRQGDIVNSNLWYQGAPSSNFSFKGYSAFSKSQRNRLPMLYVGGNDGMLHGFSAKDGTEQVAYVPKGVIPDLPLLSDPAYSHRYYVDGSPFAGDVDVSGGTPPAAWKTYLVGSLAGGGKGYFILDVTQPGSKDGSVPTTFAVANASSLVVMDRTLNASAPVTAGTEDADIGHIFAAPVVSDANPFKSSQITKMNDNRWAVVMGNGYNSTNERPVLLIQYLDGAKELKRIVATGSQVPSSPVNPVTDTNVIENGLSAPRLIDINGDGRVDVAYAGDLKGNLWKFDLTSGTASNWGVAVWGSAATTPCTTTICTPLFTAVYSGKRQAITTPPTVKANDRGIGGLMVAFGTGVNLTDAQRSSTDVHTMYSVLDNTKYKLVPGGRIVVNTTLTANPDGIGAIPATVSKTDLVKQDLNGGSIAGSGASAGQNFWKMTQNTVNYGSTGVDPNKKGWYFDFQVTGERVLKPVQFYAGTNNLAIFSTTPAYGGNGSTDESCDPAGTPEKQYLTIMNIMDGRSPGYQVWDVNGDGKYINSAAEDQGVSRVDLPPGAISIISGKKAITFSGGNSSGGGGGASSSRNGAPAPQQLLRPSWRQLQ